MSEEIYGLSEEDVGRLRRLLEAFEAGRLAVQPPARAAPLPGPLWTQLAKTSGAITAAAGSVPGEGPADLYKIDTAGGLADTTFDVTLYNPSASAIASGAWVSVARDPSSGRYLAVPQSATVTVADVDGTPSYTGTATITFDQADGFVITQPSGDTVRIDMTTADYTHVGIVSTSAQQFGGAKQADLLVAGVAGTTAVIGLGGVGGGLGTPGDPFAAPGGGTVYTMLTASGSGAAGANYAILACRTGAAGNVARLYLGSAGTLELYSSSAAPAYQITVFSVGYTTYTGAYGTDALGNVFTGGICTTVGGGTVGTTLAVGSTPITGGTAFGVLYNNGGVLGNVAPSTTAQLLMSGSIGWVSMSGDATIDTSGVLTIKTSVALAGAPTAATPTPGTNTTQIATTAFVTAAVSAAAYTNEQAQDAVGNILTDSARIDFTYNDGANTITADLISNTITVGYLSASAAAVLFGRWNTGGAGAGQEVTVGAGLDLSADGVLTGASGMTWAKVTKTYANLSAAATSNNIEAYSLPAGHVLHAVILKTTTAFSGGGITTYTLDVGMTGDLTRYLSNYNAMTAVSSTNFKVQNGAINPLPRPEDFSSATSIRLQATSDFGHNLSVATAGTVDVYLLVSTAG